MDKEQRAFEQLNVIIRTLQEFTAEEIANMLERNGLKGKLNEIFDNDNDRNSPLAQWINQQIDWPYGVFVGTFEIRMNGSLFRLPTPASIREFERNWRNGNYPQITEK